ncbi:methyltransferase small domain protein [Leptospira sp. P2653]|nr:methyltransferase small domain protein [Leptospira sp. P2653]
MSYTGKSPWKRIRNYIFPKSGFLISPKKQKPNRTLKLSATDNQPLLFDSESIKTNRSPASSPSSKGPKKIKPVFQPNKISNIEEFRNEVKRTLEKNGDHNLGNEFYELSRKSEKINELLNLSYKYVSLNSEIVNQVTRSIVSEAVKETKRSRSEAMRGNQNAAGEHKVENTPKIEIQSNSLAKIVKEFDEIPLEIKDSEYLDRIRESLSKNLIPPLITSQISDTLSKIPVKEPFLVIKVLRNYISNSLLTYNSKVEAKKFEDSNPIARTVIATKFRNLADGMTSQIENKESPGISRQNVTNRRSNIASSMREDAKNLREVQAALKGISHEIEEAILPESLKNIRSKADVETLCKIVRYNKHLEVSGRKNTRPQNIDVELRGFNYNTFFDKKENIKLNVSNGVYGHNIHWAQKLGLISKKDYNAALKFHKDHPTRESATKSNDVKEIERIFKIKDLVYKIENNLYAKPANSNSKQVVTIEGKSYELFLKNKKIYDTGNTENLRLLKLGFKTTQEVDSATEHITKLIKEYAYTGAPSEKEIKIKKMETELVGRQIPGFFPTPKTLGERMLEDADIQAGMDILEPSAGKGDLSDLIRKKHSEPDTIELNYDLREILKEKGHKVVGNDFLDYTGKQYDRIIMNPPFERGADIDHVRHAYSLLKPGGKLISIMSEGPFFRSDNKSKNFRNWLDELGGEAEELPQDSFKGSESFRQTGVNTRIVTIEKD